MGPGLSEALTWHLALPCPRALLSSVGRQELERVLRGCWETPWPCQLICCATLRKTFKFSGPSFLTYQMGVMTTRQN